MSEAPLAKVYRLEVGETRAECRVLIYPEHVEVPYAGELPDGGWFDGTFKIDRRSFDRAIDLAKEKGVTHAKIGALIQRLMGAPALVTIEHRPLLPR